MNENIKSKTVGGFIWRLLQNVSTQAVSFVIQIILARILMPEDYAVTTIIAVFITLANVFITTGFSTALVQRQNLKSVDISTVFYAGMAVALALYGILFAAAPLVAEFYDMPLIKPMLRVQSLCIVIAAAGSVHQALMTKWMQFKKGMVASLLGCITQGAVGISMALLGYGTWSLILSYVANSAVMCVVLWILIRWHPTREFSFVSVRNLLGFSVKILLINLINTLYNNVVSLVIGKAYSKDSLAYYNRGYQFPTLVMVNVDGAMNTVLFSALSNLQNDREAFMALLRRSMRISLYVCSALMLGMFAVAEPMIQVMLTDKWLGAAPYVRICCLICLMWPLSAINQALTAQGKEAVALWLNVVSKLIGLACLLIAAQFDVYTFVLSSVVSGVISQVICMVVYHRTLGYKIRQQLSDIFGAVWRAGIMLAVVYPIKYLGLPPVIELFSMVASGVAVVILLSCFIKCDEFRYVWSLVSRKNGK